MYFDVYASNADIFSMPKLNENPRPFFRGQNGAAVTFSLTTLGLTTLSLAGQIAILSRTSTNFFTLMLIVVILGPIL
jgi:hypothetical protein